MNSFTTVFIPIAFLITMTQVGAQEPTVVTVPIATSNRERLLQRVTSGTKTAISSTSDSVVSLIDTGLGYLGIRYRKGGNGPESGGFDCSGLVKKVFGTSMGLSLPRTAAISLMRTLPVKLRWMPTRL